MLHAAVTQKSITHNYYDNSIMLINKISDCALNCGMMEQ